MTNEQIDDKFQEYLIEWMPLAEDYDISLAQQAFHCGVRAALESSGKNDALYWKEQYEIEVEKNKATQALRNKFVEVLKEAYPNIKIHDEQ